MGLFDSQIERLESETEAQRKTFELFDHSRRQIVSRNRLTEKEAASSNRHFKGSMCPHLSWQEEGSGEVKTKIYKIKSEF